MKSAGDAHIGVDDRHVRALSEAPASEAEAIPTRALPAIVVAASRRAKRAGLPDMTPEEYQQRGDAAEALWRELQSGR